MRATAHFARGMSPVHSCGASKTRAQPWALRHGLELGQTLHSSHLLACSPQHAKCTSDVSAGPVTDMQVCAGVGGLPIWLAQKAGHCREHPCASRLAAYCPIQAIFSFCEQDQECRAPCLGAGGVRGCARLTASPQRPARCARRWRRGAARATQQQPGGVGAAGGAGGR